LLTTLANIIADIDTSCRKYRRYR